MIEKEVASFDGFTTLHHLSCDTSGTEVMLTLKCNKLLNFHFNLNRCFLTLINL